CLGRRAILGGARDRGPRGGGHGMSPAERRTGAMSRRAGGRFASGGRLAARARAEAAATSGVVVETRRRGRRRDKAGGAVVSSSRNSSPDPAQASRSAQRGGANQVPWSRTTGSPAKSLGSRTEPTTTSTGSPS